jgi:phenylpyruvate tautomerase
MLAVQFLLVTFGVLIHFALSITALVSPVPILVFSRNPTSFNMAVHADDSDTSQMNSCPHPFTELPGDPSLLVVTNVDLGNKKLDIMKQCSKAICEATGKPEAYIGVSITDKASMIFGGSDAPCALGNMYSIGAIAMESNGKIQAAVTDLLEPFGVAENRIYINFFDMPRANVGWSRRTFAG